MPHTPRSPELSSCPAVLLPLLPLAASVNGQPPGDEASSIAQGRVRGPCYSGHRQRGEREREREREGERQRVPRSQIFSILLITVFVDCANLTGGIASVTVLVEESHRERERDRDTEREGERERVPRSQIFSILLITVVVDCANLTREVASVTVLVEESHRETQRQREGDRERQGEIEEERDGERKRERCLTITDISIL